THRPQTVRPLSVVRSAVFVILTQFPLQSYSSQDSQSQYARFARCDSSFDISYDGDVELVRLAGAAIEEPTASYASEETVAGHSRCYENPRSPSEKTLQQDDMLHDITKMLLASSPLDRLNYLARIELKNMGWFERTDQWAIVEMGLSDLPLPVTPPKAIAENVPTAIALSGLHTESHNSLPPLPLQDNLKKSLPPLQSPQTPSTKPVRTPNAKHHTRQPAHSHAHNYDPDERKAEAHGQAQSQTHSPSRDADPSLDDFSTLSYDASAITYANITTPIRTSRPSRTQTCARPQEQTRRRLGRAVRNFVKKMLSLSSGAGGTTLGGRGKGSSSEPGPRGRHNGSTKDRDAALPIGSTEHRDVFLCRTSGSTCGDERERETPRSDRSGDSGWTFASVSSWTGPVAGQQAHGGNRWSGLWH
ncbi:hypothetical protein PAXINDRAFT_21941, partial [Paxillus involutus ATCC 200175]